MAHFDAADSEVMYFGKRERLLKMTERLDKVESDIQDINATLAAIASDFLRPTVQQSVENRMAIEATERRLDRIAEVLAETTIKQEASAEIAKDNVSAIAANERRFENLLNELRADRAESRQRFEAQEKRFEAQQRRFEAQQENIQTLFLELTRTNRRVDSIEQAS